jgi:hypothetical protein
MWILGPAYTFVHCWLIMANLILPNRCECFLGNVWIFKRIGVGFLGSHDRLLIEIIQDCLLVFFVYHIVSTGLAWVVWGLMACSLLLPPLLSLRSHLALTFLLPLSILVGFYVGVSKFDTNTKCFALLLIVTYWWLAHLLPSLGWCLLSLILAPPWSGHADGTAYRCKYTGHKFPRHC